MKNKEAPHTSNIYKAARLEAAKNNPTLETAEKAHTLINISREKLGKIEQEDRSKQCAFPSSDEVNRMIHVYNAPELRNHFCTSLCPLGEGLTPLEYQNLDRISLHLLVTLQQLEQLRADLGTILLDGNVTPSEREKFVAIVKTLKDISTHAGSLELWAQKNGLIP